LAQKNQITTALKIVLGGDYFDVSDVVFVPKGIDTTSKLFQGMTGIDPVHIIHFSEDVEYSINGQKINN